jgi:hypothetical protein
MTGSEKQSIARATVTMDCFVASLLAMTPRRLVGRISVNVIRVKAAELADYAYG